MVRLLLLTTLILSLGGMLVAAIVVSLRMWIDLGDVGISAHGFIALALGTILSLALGMGLMYLVFYSSRHGHDDDIGR